MSCLSASSCVTIHDNLSKSMESKNVTTLKDHFIEWSFILVYIWFDVSLKDVRFSMKYILNTNLYILVHAALGHSPTQKMSVSFERY